MSGRGGRYGVAPEFLASRSPHHGFDSELEKLQEISADAARPPPTHTLMSRGWDMKHGRCKSSCLPEPAHQLPQNKFCIPNLAQVHLISRTVNYVQNPSSSGI